MGVYSFKVCEEGWVRYEISEEKVITIINTPHCWYEPHKTFCRLIGGHLFRPPFRDLVLQMTST